MPGKRNINYVYASSPLLVFGGKDKVFLHVLVDGRGFPEPRMSNIFLAKFFYARTGMRFS
jgi:hypothetical protein